MLREFSAAGRRTRILWYSKCWALWGNRVRGKVFLIIVFLVGLVGSAGRDPVGYCTGANTTEFQNFEIVNKLPRGDCMC